jgi:ketosteroid isomerase-like protein
MDDREAFEAEVLRMQHLGEAALARGDAGPRISLWSHADPVSLFAAVGPTKVGWAELEPTFRRVASRLSGGRDVRYELVACDVSGDVGWSAGIGRFVVSMDGAEPSAMAIRLTHAYRREGGAWKVVHEHSDFVAAEHEVGGPG